MTAPTRPQELYDAIEREQKLAEIERWECELLIKLLGEKRVKVTPRVEPTPEVHWAWRKKAS